MAETHAPTPLTAETLPAGDYAIVEILGHRTLVGRVTEVERFGTKLMQIEPLFRDTMLPPVLVGGGSIYQFTPCPPDRAWERRPQAEWRLPESVRDAMSALALPAPDNPSDYGEGDEFVPPAFLVDDDKCQHIDAEQHADGSWTCSDCGALVEVPC